MECIKPEDIINKETFKPLESTAICGLCNGVIIDPIQCQGCDSCYCKDCIDDYSKTSSKWPAGCTGGALKESRMMKNILSVLKFKCKNGCEEEIPYLELRDHYQEKCKKMNYRNKCENLKKEIDNLKNKIYQIKKNLPKIYHWTFKSKHHRHALVLCTTSRNAYSCNVCRTSFLGSTFGFYCTACDYDLCVKCKQNEEQGK